MPDTVLDTATAAARKSESARALERKILAAIESDPTILADLHARIDDDREVEWTSDEPG